MKKITFILFALIAGTTFAQNNAEAFATTTAEIVEPLKISSNRNLNFGKIIGGSAGGGKVIIPAVDAPTRTIPEALNAPGGTITSARFLITASESYSISITDNNLTVRDTEGTILQSMTYTPVTSYGTATELTGDQTIYVGGELVVGADQAVGVYDGTVTITVNYN